VGMPHKKALGTADAHRIRPGDQLKN